MTPAIVKMSEARCRAVQPTLLTEIFSIILLSRRNLLLLHEHLLLAFLDARPTRDELLERFHGRTGGKCIFLPRRDERDGRAWRAVEIILIPARLLCLPFRFV